MIKQTRWIDRKFNFDFPAGVFPCLLERLKGTPLRVKELVKDLPESTLNNKPDGKWSIKEHIGHIANVESLWEKRVDQFIAGVETLVAADMSNQRTTDANFNDRNIKDLLENLTKVRTDFTTKLDKLDEATITRTALHPRLNKPMRLIDLVYFACEHDDNELALMRMKSKL